MTMDLVITNLIHLPVIFVLGISELLIVIAMAVSTPMEMVQAMLQALAVSIGALSKVPTCGLMTLHNGLIRTAMAMATTEQLVPRTLISSLTISLQQMTMTAMVILIDGPLPTMVRMR